MYNWYSSYADLSIPSASVPITKQKHTKPYDSFPNQKSVDSHHNSKSSIVCTNCFSTICKPIRISDPEILVYWTYQEWKDSVRLPVGDTPRPSLTSITRIRILSPLHSVTHVSYRLLTFERGIHYILSGYLTVPLLWMCSKKCAAWSFASGNQYNNGYCWTTMDIVGPSPVWQSADYRKQEGNNWQKQENMDFFVDWTGGVIQNSSIVHKSYNHHSSHFQCSQSTCKCTPSPFTVSFFKADKEVFLGNISETLRHFIRSLSYRVRRDEPPVCHLSMLE